MNILKKRETKIYPPVIGSLIPLEKVNDPVFSTGMMGPGFAMIPQNGDIFSPVDGKVSSIFPTKHAISLISNNKKYELMLHLGIDTVDLNGEGFEMLVKEGDVVTVNQKLVHINLSFLKKMNKQNTIITIFPELEIKFDISEKEIVDRSNIIISLK